MLSGQKEVYIYLQSFIYLLPSYKYDVLSCMCINQMFVYTYNYETIIHDES